MAILVFLTILLFVMWLIPHIVYKWEAAHGFSKRAKRIYNRFTGKTKGIYSLTSDELIEDGDSYDNRRE